MERLEILLCTQKPTPPVKSTTAKPQAGKKAASSSSDSDSDVPPNPKPIPKTNTDIKSAITVTAKKGAQKQATVKTVALKLANGKPTHESDSDSSDDDDVAPPPAKVVFSLKIF